MHRRSIGTTTPAAAAPVPATASSIGTPEPVVLPVFWVGRIMDHGPTHQPQTVKSEGGRHASDRAPDRPKLVPGDLEAPPPPPSSAAPDPTDAGHSSLTLSSDPARELPTSAPAASATPEPAETNAIVSCPPVAASSSISTIDSVRDVLGRFGKKVVEATKQAEDLAGNVWQHLKTGPSITDAAMGIIAQGTKVIAEGGYEKIFRQTFETLPEEQLKNSYACYLSTSAGPVMGILYLSSAKLAFCSDSPLSYKVGDQTEWSYYKVIIPLHQLRQVNPSGSKANPAEKYVQVISIDNHEFWFMGFLNYHGAAKSLEEALHGSGLQPE